MAYVFSPEIEEILARGPPVIDWDEISENLRLEYLGWRASATEAGAARRPVFGTTAGGGRVADEGVKGQFHCGEWACLEGRNVTADVTVRGPILRVGDGAIGALADEGSVWWTFSAASARELNSMGVDKVRCITSRSWLPTDVGVVYRGYQDTDAEVDRWTSCIFSLVLDTLTYVTVHRDDTTRMASAAGHMFDNGGRVCGWAAFGAECLLCLDTGRLHGVVPTRLAGMLDGDDDYCVCAAGNHRIERDEVDGEIEFARANGMDQGRWLGRYDGGHSDEYSDVSSVSSRRAGVDDSEEAHAQLVRGASECGVDNLYAGDTPPAVGWPEGAVARSRGLGARVRLGGCVANLPRSVGLLAGDVTSLGLRVVSKGLSRVAPGAAAKVKSVAQVVDYKVALTSELCGYCYLSVVVAEFGPQAVSELSPWPFIDELLDSPFEWFDMEAVKEARVERVVGQCYHLLSLGSSDGEYLTTLLSRRCVDGDSWQWPVGSLGSHIAVALAHGLEPEWCRGVLLDDIDSDAEIGGLEVVAGDPDALAVWLEERAPGLRGVVSAEEMVLVSRTPALLCTADKRALRVLELLGDAALSMAVLDEAASCGLSVDDCTRFKESVVSNKVLSALFARVVPSGLVSVVVGVDPSKGRVGACVIEAWIGLVHTRVGYRAAADFCRSIGVFDEVPVELSRRSGRPGGVGTVKPVVPDPGVGSWPITVYRVWWYSCSVLMVVVAVVVGLMAG